MGGGFASLGSAWGSLSPACFVLSIPTWWERCKQVSNFAGVPFSLSPVQCFLLCPSKMHPQTQTHSHQTHTFTETDTLTHQHTHTHTRVHVCTPECTRSYTHFGTHTHSCSLSILHTPLVSILDVRIRQSAVDTPSQSLFLAAVPSLQSLFLSKQNKMKSNTDLI